MIIRVCGVILTASAVFVAGRWTAREATVVAQVGSRTITLDDVDRAWEQFNPGGHARTIQELYDARQSTLERLLAGIAVERAAAARGVTADQYVKEEMERRRQPVTAADVELFYEEQKGGLQGRSLEQERAGIESYLVRQHAEQALKALVAELEKAGPLLRVALEPPRFKVDIAADDPADGPPTAPVLIVEFSDYQCPFCADLAPTLKKVRTTYGNRVRFVWKDFPLDQIHPESFKAAQGAHCAGDQGRYWEYHTKLFANQQALDPGALKAYAVEIGLDGSRFAACFDSSRFSESIRQATKEGSRLGVESTPTTFINGRVVTGVQSFEYIARIVDDELKRAGR